MNQGGKMEKIESGIRKDKVAGIEVLRIPVRVTFLEEALGMAPASKEVYRAFIAAKAPDAPTTEEEVAAYGVDEVADAGMTRFPRSADGEPIMLDYQVKGFFKDSCGFLRRVKGTKSSKVTAYKKVIDGTIFIEPREIALKLPVGRECGVCERPLRAQTAQGERVALASSETVPAGTQIDFDVLLLNATDEGLVREWLDYGCLHGLLQWRNSGKGRFAWEIRG